MLDAAKQACRGKRIEQGQDTPKDLASRQRMAWRELKTRLDRSSARSQSKTAEAGERSVKEGIEAGARRRTKDKCGAEARSSLGGRV